MKKIVWSIVVALLTVRAGAFELKSGQTVTVSCDTGRTEPVVKSALRMLTGDMAKVLSAKVCIGKEGSIIVRQDGRALNNRKEAFRLQVSGDTLRITGSDAHGVAYGLLEVSRCMNVLNVIVGMWII